MLKRTIVKSAKPLCGIPSVQHRSLSTSIARMAEGDTGGARSGGEAQGDAFTKREKANEDYYVRQKENEKLMALKLKLSQQRKHLDELEKHIDSITADQGGEKN